MITRKEADSIGTMEVPMKAYYGVQTLRAKKNFHITGRPLHPEFIKNLVRIKKAAACGSRDRKNSFNHCIKIKFLSPDYKAQNPKIDTKHEASQ